MRHLPLLSTRSVPTTIVVARSPCWLLLVSTGTQRGTTPGIQSGVTAAQFLSEHYGASAMLMALLLGIALTTSAKTGPAKLGAH